MKVWKTPVCTKFSQKKGNKTSPNRTKEVLQILVFQTRFTQVSPTKPQVSPELLPFGISCAKVSREGWESADWSGTSPAPGSPGVTLPLPLRAERNRSSVWHGPQPHKPWRCEQPALRGSQVRLCRQEGKDQRNPKTTCPQVALRQHGARRFAPAASHSRLRKLERFTNLQGQQGRAELNPGDAALAASCGALMARSPARIPAAVRLPSQLPAGEGPQPSWQARGASPERNSARQPPTPQPLPGASGTAGDVTDDPSGGLLFPHYFLQ